MKKNIVQTKSKPTLNTLSGGMSSSFVIACKRRGAEVSDCKAAPNVDNKEPITIRNG